MSGQLLQHAHLAKELCSTRGYHIPECIGVAHAWMIQRIVEFFGWDSVQLKETPTLLAVSVSDGKNSNAIVLYNGLTGFDMNDSIGMLEAFIKNSRRYAKGKSW